MVAFCAAKRNTTVPSVKRIYASYPASRSTTSGSTTRQPPRAPARARSTRAPAAAVAPARELPTFHLALVGFIRKPSQYKPSRALVNHHLYLWHDGPFRNGRLSNLLFVARGQCADGTTSMSFAVRTLHPASKFLIVTVPLCWTERDFSTRTVHAHRGAAKFVLYLCQLDAAM